MQMERIIRVISSTSSHYPVPHISEPEWWGWEVEDVLDFSSRQTRIVAQCYPIVKKEHAIRMIVEVVDHYSWGKDRMGNNLGDYRFFINDTEVTYEQLKSELNETSDNAQEVL